MLFHEYGDSTRPTIILLHGGGLSDWSLEALRTHLAEHYHVVTPIIDGHGDDAQTPFIAIETSAQNLLRYIDTQLNKRVFALAGLSLGGQIVVELLSQRSDVAQYAIIESALVIPIKGVGCYERLSRPLYPLAKRRWFARLQVKALFIPDKLFEGYYRDSAKMSALTLKNITLSNGRYAAKTSLKRCEAKTLIVCGSKEIASIKRSARLLSEMIPTSRLYIAEGMQHGEISLSHPDTYAELLNAFFEEG